MPRRQKKQFALLLLAALAAGLVFVLAACNKRKNDAAQTPIPIDFDLAERTHRQRQPQTPENLQPILRGINSPSNPKCREGCKRICMRGRQCNVPGFRESRRCVKLCLAACNRNLIPESIGKCIKKDSECKEVVECLRQLRDILQQQREKIIKKREQQQQQNAGDQPAAEAPE